jgi:hypothetical protein
MSEVVCKSIDSLEKCCETNHCNPNGFNPNDTSIKRCQRLGKSKKHKACKSQQQPPRNDSTSAQHCRGYKNKPCPDHCDQRKRGKDTFCYPKQNRSRHNRQQPNHEEEEEKEEGDQPNIYQGKKCFDIFTQEEEDITEYLNKDSDNFIIDINGSYSCHNIKDIRELYHIKPPMTTYNGLPITHHYREWLVCREANHSLNPDNIVTNTLDPNYRVIVKLDTNKGTYHIIRPRWYWNGKPPGNRIYNLVEVDQVAGLVSTSILLYRGSVVSGDHCNHTQPVKIYNLVPTQEGGDLSGGGIRIDYYNLYKKYKNKYKNLVK